MKPATTVLIVEDSPTQAEQLCLGLEARDYIVVVANSGEDGLALARKIQPDIVVTDVVMPKMDGYELCRAIKADEQLRTVPVILVTALSRPEDVLKGLDCGADNLFRKPHDIDDLNSHIHYLLANRSLRQQRYGAGIGVKIALEVEFAGRRHVITSSQQQILDLLLSTYEQAVRMQSELEEFNAGLEQQVAERTAALQTEITEREHIEEELRRTKQAAEAANQAKSGFLANVSHEMRTPLTSILGLTELLTQTALTAEQEHHLRLIRTSAESLLTVINDVLDLSKIEAGKLRMAATAFDLRRGLDRMLAPLVLRAERKQLTVRCEVGAEVPEYLAGDMDRLSQVLVNLVDNAIKFTASGEIVVAVRRATPSEQPPIEWNAPGQAPLALHFSVRDTGIGIPPEQSHKIFGAFEQVDPTNARRYGGTGLGLSIARRLVEMMGGTVWLESAVGLGSTFHFTAQLAPAASPAETAPGATAAGREVAPAATARPLRLLLAEDNDINREMIATLLRSMGHTVEVAGDGTEALQVLAHGAFDLVLMDVQMPGTDGLQATEAIREQERGSGAHVPIIALTACAMNGDEERCHRAGMDGFIAKPISAADLARLVDRWAAGAQGPAPGPRAATAT